MLKYNCGVLTAADTRALAKLQAKVDAKKTREEQYVEASRLFKSKTSSAWVRIKEALRLVAPGGDACYYCERDRHRDIEHVRPKRHYPDQTFDWGNYVYACTICNQDKKGDKYGVIDGSLTLIEFNRSIPFTDPLPTGVDALIDIRKEDPLDFLKLDFDSGAFVAIGDATGVLRGKFTRDLFELNGGELPRARARAVISFTQYLRAWNEAYNNNDQVKTAAAETELMTLQYPTVLVEMRRQASNYPELEKLFENLPTAIGAR